MSKTHRVGQLCNLIRATSKPTQGKRSDQIRGALHEARPPRQSPSAAPHAARAPPVVGPSTATTPGISKHGRKNRTVRAHLPFIERAGKSASTRSITTGLREQTLRFVCSIRSAPTATRQAPKLTSNMRRCTQLVSYPPHQKCRVAPRGEHPPPSCNAATARAAAESARGEPTLTRYAARAHIYSPSRVCVADAIRCRHSSTTAWCVSSNHLDIRDQAGAAESPQDPLLSGKRLTSLVSARKVQPPYQANPSGVLEIAPGETSVSAIHDSRTINHQLTEGLLTPANASSRRCSLRPRT
ncbi:hypothetical protein FQR65_LT20072 [Abscondita terminalis]|nr:hypothetical protein FQR65_LT20072 [Abscondita terminalis]